MLTAVDEHGGGQHDTYGFALAAYAGKSQGRPPTNASSQLIEHTGLPVPTCPSAPVPDGRTIRLLTSSEGPAADAISFIPDTNAIESTFATVRLRTRKTKGAGSRAAGLAMAFKLLEAAEQRWRCVNAPYLVALVRAGATFVDGVKVEREDTRDVA